MKKYIYVILSFLIISCQYDKKDIIKPSSSGKTGEVLVVIKDKIWQSPVGDTIFNQLSEPFLVLPQDEPIFDVVHIPNSAFENLFKTHRNIIYIDIDEKNTETKFDEIKDKWANNQKIYYFYAPNDSAFIVLWNENVDELKRSIFLDEIGRYQQAFIGSQNSIALTKIAEKFGVNFILPSDYNLDVLKDNFCWISRETEISSQGIFIYDYPYTDSNTFTLDYLIAKRDYITKTYVPGPEKGSFMQTEKQVPMVTEEINLNGSYAFVIRGLWYTENYFLGGPFISITKLDEKNNRVVTIESYVYAGKQNKKLYMWQVEAIVKSFEIL